MISIINAHLNINFLIALSRSAGTFYSLWNGRLIMDIDLQSTVRKATVDWLVLLFKRFLWESADSGLRNGEAPTVSIHVARPLLRGASNVHRTTYWAISPSHPVQVATW